MKDLLDEVLGELPLGVARPALKLFVGMARVLLCRDDPARLEEALMRTAEDIADEANRAKFENRPRAKPE